MTTTRTARQLARFAPGTQVIASHYVGRSGFEQGDGRTRWTIARGQRGWLTLEGRTADKAFVRLDDPHLFEVVGR